ncbi:MULTISPECIES: ammonium transporter [unclassified Oceanobacillus]|uniref:ammonium transporter n=1 Tax=unclassified Oceanobacillus TaxID=2630292 RepID=UPI001BE77A25|nr:MULTISPECIES: ammonium transporter [unclassified Oceanobacillus]MBT2599030.1 ammonium transporter [Oceanobacillus sp. ISL-74]MBT2651948.1 ammonium transporter [Oceanobacillus sp. ISL-73]
MIKKISLLFTILLLLSTPVYAATPTPESLELSVNLIWVMLGAFLVFFMHAGFAMVESGFTRSKNTLNILMKNFLTISVAAILFFLVGYGIMFGSSSGSIIGSDGFLLSGVSEIDFFVFQAMFVATCATIISGAVAERIKLGSYILIVAAMTTIIYPVVGHWVWQGDGWLTAIGFSDFAGSTVVHLTGAVGAFVVVLILGPRIGKYKGKKVNVIQGHNLPLGALGVFILWLGWFGFNGGSTLAADPSLVPYVIGTTLLSTSAALVSSSLYTKIRFKKVDASLSMNGVLGGLVGITAGAAEISLGGSIIVGLISGVVLVEGIRFLDTKLRIDDPVGAIAVHGICGIWGTLAIGLFSVNTGLFYGNGISQLGIQAIGVLAVIAWVAITTGGFAYVMNKFSPIRVSEEEEISGLDFAEHGSSAYNFKESLLEGTDNNSSSGLAERLNNNIPIGETSNQSS